MADNQRPLDEIILEHIEKMLHAPSAPELPPEVADNEKLRALHDLLAGLRHILTSFAKGDLSQDILLRGVVAGKLKGLQAHLLHLTWQIQQVAAGDFTQRVEFMGDFAKAFNSMVEQLDSALTALRHKEEELTSITQALRHEVQQKDNALVALSKSEARFRYMAEHDTLTGVLNRRSFYDLAALELDIARQKQFPCNLVMLDIDHFKRFNDTYGHLEGDAALRHVTETAKAALRQEDLMGRYGGEEFVLFLPHTDLEEGKNIADRLRIAIADSPVQTKRGPVPVTVSMGLAHVPPDLGKKRDVPFLEEALGLADDALYAAKKAGRNCLMIASPQPGTAPEAGASR
ncbi:GGDEF domain-containing protein [Desulfovibrio sp. OttesenSCG-928-O18]|nr:GGDEF domain-containing protein [Desulfovibrio sp. OttesenSCG-928-O18]